MVHPPSLEEKYQYAHTNKAFLYVFSILSFLILITGIGFFSFSNSYVVWYLSFGIITFIYLIISFGIGIFSEEFDIVAYELERRGSVRPSVDIFLPSCGEPLEIIQNTILCAVKAASKYGNAKVFVLDDAKNQDLEFWCIRYGIPYAARETNELKKAGNLRNAFKQTSGEWILILDADFAVREEMLIDLAPFTEDRRTAIIQTPQYFRVKETMGFVEAGAGFIQELFYRLIQVNRNHFGAPICVGTCGLYRRKALEPFGGTAPIGYSEDLHTGFQVMTHGWKVRYFPISFAAGICPDKIRAFFTQQYRWCMGSVSLMFTRHFWTAPNVDILQRICFLSGMLYYIVTALGVVMTVIPSLIVLYFFPEMARWYSILFSVPSLLTGTLIIALWSKHRFGLYALESRIISYWAHLFALIDKSRGDLMPWVPTGTVTTTKRHLVFKYSFISYTLMLVFLYLFGAHKNNYSIDVMPMVVISMFYRILELKICYHLIKEK